MKQTVIISYINPKILIKSLKYKLKRFKTEIWVKFLSLCHKFQIGFTNPNLYKILMKRKKING